MDKNKKLTLWLTILVANAIVLYVASLFFPDHVVLLGNATLTNWLSAVVTALVLTIILRLVKPLLTATNLKVKGDLPINITYLITNIVGLWVLGRLANYVGFGISSFVVVIVLGAVLSLVQYGAWKMVGVK